MPTTSTTPNEDSIRAIAYRMWIEEGRPEGRAEAHWMKAYELVAVESKSPAAAKKTNGTAKKATRRKAS